MTARFSLVALDCAEPDALAAFYSALTGWPVESSDEDDWVQLASPQGPTLAFQRVVDRQAPDWSEGANAQQLHLDFDVDDLDEGEARAVSLGARKVEYQPKPQYWRVFLDPAGHPFCLVLDASLRE